MIDDDDPLEPDANEEIPEQPEDEPDNAADGRKVKRRERRLDRERREGEEFWRGIFASEVGRREMWAILSASGIRAERFGAGPNGFPDPNATWFRLGVQTVARELLDNWQVKDFEGVHMMLREHDPRFAKAKMPPSKQGER